MTKTAAANTVITRQRNDLWCRARTPRQGPATLRNLTTRAKKCHPIRNVTKPGRSTTLRGRGRCRRALRHRPVDALEILEGREAADDPDPAGAHLNTHLGTKA